MKKILLFGGTSEGRRLAEWLEASGVPADVCVATEYGERLLPESRFIHVLRGRMDEEQMAACMREGDYREVVDATHPYAAIVSQNVKKACEQTGLPYLRLLRAESGMDEDVISVSSVEEAAEYLRKTEGNVLLTTGSKELKKYSVVEDYQNRLFARVLPSVESIEACSRLGLTGSHCIAMQGPFSREMNTAMLRSIQAAYLVTKESGKPGGFAEKLQAAREAGAKVICVCRPVQERGYSMEEIGRELGLQETEVSESEPEKSPAAALEPEAGALVADASEKEAEILTAQKQEDSSAVVQEKQTKTKLENGSENQMAKQASLVGIGMGSENLLTGEAVKALQEADIIFGASRILASLTAFDKPKEPLYLPQAVHDYLENHPQYQKIAVAFSGDVGFYSGAKKMMTALGGWELSLVPGVSSVVYFCSRLGMPWEDVKLVSMHGRRANLIAAVRTHGKVFSLVGGNYDTASLCRELQEYGFSDVTVHVGQELSYPGEHLYHGTPAEMAALSWEGLQVVLIENPKAECQPVTHGLPDDAFLRGKVPMTKEEVRSVSLSKLRLTRNAVVYDVGAGTGSVSVEMARMASEGMVYAIEKNPEAIGLLEDNKKRLGVPNLKIVAGLAPEAMEGLPAPTHVFIGGSSGQMEDILNRIRAVSPRARVVINAITAETIADILKAVQTGVEDFDLVQLSAARAKTAGKYHLMMGQNPVWIASFTMAEPIGESHPQGETPQRKDGEK